VQYQCFDVHAPSEDKSDDSKYSFYEELDRVLHHFLKCHMKILKGDFYAKLVRENFLNRQFGMRVYIRIVMIMKLEY
jgi:hypothetical protein